MHPTEICWTWDRLKASTNLRKHRVSFELAALALEDPNQISQLDSESYEYRFKTLASVGGITLLIVHTEPEVENYSGQLIGRIISARKAKPAESKAYSHD